MVNALMQFEAVLQKPAHTGKDGPWGFIILPADISEKLPRRGRTSVDVQIDAHAFRVQLEPDGRKSHWLRLDTVALDAVGDRFGDSLVVKLQPVDPEPDPELPPDLAKALSENADARNCWEATTTIARVDWIHWICSAKQAKTRSKRILSACDMLASGKKRVCCFDTSGFYSKAFRAPEAAD